MADRNPTPGALIVTGASPGGIGAAVLDAFSGKFAPGRTHNLDLRDPTGPIDVRDAEQVAQAIREAVVPGEMNYLLHAAGIVHLAHPESGEPIDFFNSPLELLHQMITVNVGGTINVLRAFADALRERAAQGNVVVVSSISAEYSGGAAMAVYGATKAAISWLSQQIAVHPRWKVNILEPGSVRTNIGAWTPAFSENLAGREMVAHGQDGDAARLGGEVSKAMIVEEVRYLFFAPHGRNGSRVMVDLGLTTAGREGYDG